MPEKPQKWTAPGPESADAPGEAAAFEAGKDYAAVGANGHNCHFRHFATRERTKAWERGRDSGSRRLSNHA